LSSDNGGDALPLRTRPNKLETRCTALGRGEGACGAVALSGVGDLGLVLEGESGLVAASSALEIGLALPASTQDPVVVFCWVRDNGGKLESQLRPAIPRLSGNRLFLIRWCPSAFGGARS